MSSTGCSPVGWASTAALLGCSRVASGSRRTGLSRASRSYSAGVSATCTQESPEGRPLFLSVVSCGVTEGANPGPKPRASGASGVFCPTEAGTTSPLTICVRAIGASLTLAVSIPRRCAAFGVRITRLRFVPWIGSKVTAGVPFPKATPEKNNARSRTRAFMRPLLSKRRHDAVLADENEHRGVASVRVLPHAHHDRGARADQAALAERHPEHRHAGRDLDVGLVEVGRPVLDRQHPVLEVVDPAVRHGAVRAEVPRGVAHRDAAQLLVDDAQLEAAVEPRQRIAHDRAVLVIAHALGHRADIGAEVDVGEARLA